VVLRLGGKYWEDGMKEILVNIHVEPLAEGGFLATSDDLPGLVAQGRTVAETLEIAQDVARKLVESYTEHGDELPPALREHPATAGDLRIPVTIG
jgi:predicted RNase H-like HicB family nuclease